MQDGVGLPFFTSSSRLTDFHCRGRNNLNTAPFRLGQDFIHYRKRAMGAGCDKEPLASPGNFFLGRKRRVTKLFAECLDGPFFRFRTLPLSITTSCV